MSGVLLLLGLLEIDGGLGADAELEVLLELARVAKVNVVVGAEPEDRGPEEPEPPEEAADEALSVLRNGFRTGCDDRLWPEREGDGLSDDNGDDKDRQVKGEPHGGGGVVAEIVNDCGKRWRSCYQGCRVRHTETTLTELSPFYSRTRFLQVEWLCPLGTPPPPPLAFSPLGTRVTLT